MLFRKSQHEWAPPFLRRPTFLGFAAVFAALAIGLGIVFGFSDEHYGLTTPLVKYRYLWTYCPSTLFIIISGLWVVSDSSAKILTPWRAIPRSSGVSKADLTLDYLSNNHYVAVYKSWKMSRWAVTLTAAGTICIDILIVLSTGLFVLQPTSLVSLSYNFSTTTELNRTNWRRQSGDSITTVLAIAQYGASYSSGSTGDFAYASVDLRSIPSDASAELVVNAIQPEVYCEVGNATWSLGMYENGNTTDVGAKISITNNKCNTTYVWPLISSTILETFLFNLGMVECDDPSRLGSMARKIFVFAGSMSITDLNITATKRNLTKATREAIEGYYFTPMYNRTLSSKAAVAFCDISPRLRNATWSLDKDQRSQREALVGCRFECGQMEQCQRAYTSNYECDDSSSDGKGYGRCRVSVVRRHPAFRKVASQIMADSLFPKGQGSITGQLTVDKNRLIVSFLILGLVVFVLALTTGICIILSICARFSTTSNPSTIAGKAVCLAAIPSVMELYQACIQQGNQETKYLQVYQDVPWLSDGDSWTQSGIEVNKGDVSVDAKNIAPSAAKVSAWWSPWSQSILTHVLVVLLPCVGIALLEGFLRISDAHQGITTVTTHGLSQLAWVYIPVLIVFFLNTVSTAISSTNRIIQPYVAMREAPCTASRSLSLDLTNTVMVWAMWLAVKCKHFGTSAAIFATILDATLPIAISRLYRTHNVEQSNGISVQQTSNFDASLSLTTRNTSVESFPLPGLLLFQSLPFPRWSSRNYVLPSLQVNMASGNNLRLDNTDNSTVLVELPALSGILNCTIVDAKPTFSAVPPGLNTINSAGVLRTNFTLGDDCPRMSFSSSFSVSEFVLARLFAVIDLRFANGSVLPPAQVNDTGKASYHGPRAIPPHCLLAVAHMARGRYWNLTQKVNVTDSIFMGCSPFVQQETLAVNLSLPNFDIDPTQAPAPKPGTKSSYSEAEIVNPGTFMYYLPTIQFQQADPKLPILDPDSFFDAVFNGNDGFLASSLMSSNLTFSKDTTLLDRFRERMDYVYGLTVSQIYNGRKRFPVSDEASMPLFNATLVRPVGARIIQDEISTRIVQGILAAMMLCAIASSLLIKGGRVLPPNPCSIGTVAILLANSSILSEDVGQLESDSVGEKAFKQRIMSEGYLYSLGWWGSGEKAWYGIDIGKADKERSD
ncbi:hypothetical protein EK21DRAFT_87287 [Setomelanomma holmii]|uniref:Uncharacterized protein n=1 Tax=Setomelanomma holmii TaxID=210430 RepID=A0A9P4LQ71_9PLEO|nr:hypothetical protein EK21DRAFT_87287 [Setomelanomma holmii]